MELLQELIQSEGFTATVKLYLLESNAERICRDWLSEYLYHSKFDDVSEGEYNRELIVVDIVHEALLYCVSKGFNVKDSVALILVIVKGFHFLTTTGPIERFEQYLLDISYPVFSRYSLQSATEYLQIFVQHVHLYQYLLTDTQEENKHSITLDLMIGPVNVSRLNEGCLEKKWLEREKLENLEESYIESKKELESFKNIALKEKREKLQKFMMILSKILAVVQQSLRIN